MKTTATLAIAALASLQALGVASAGQCDAIKDNLDFPGNDLSTISAPNAESCCNACSLVDACHAFTWTQWNGGSCFLKTMVSAKPVYNPPAADGSAYMRSGIVYKCGALKYGTDLSGTIGNAPSPSVEGCCGICRNTNECTKFSWNNYNGGTCWLKTGANQYLISAPGVASAWKF